MSEREWVARMAQVLGPRKAGAAARVVKAAIGSLDGSRVTARFDWSKVRFTYVKTAGFGTEEYKPNYSIVVALDG